MAIVESRRSMHLGGMLALIVALSGQVACQKPSTGPSEAVPPSYFGMHIHKFPEHPGMNAGLSSTSSQASGAQNLSWPNVVFGSWRLWDAKVMWSEIEPQKGVWKFDRLDSAVEISRLRGVDILLTLGLTPGWASARPGEPSDYEPGNAAPPKDMADWKDYVRSVGTRYKGRIRAYEIWNEPNREADFSGGAATMAEMTKEASIILKQIDPQNIIVSASPTTVNGLRWFDEYLAHGAGNYVDAIGYHLYVTPDPPERMLPLAASVKRVMTAHGLGDKPLWNTESGWTKPKQFPSQDEAAAYLSRAYILNWFGGVKRFYWYAWDNYWWVTLFTTDASTRKPTKAAAAYETTEEWLSGAVMRNCNSNSQGVWSCQLDRESSHSWIVWRPDGNTNFRVPPLMGNVREAVGLDGQQHKINSGALTVGISPLLLIP